jgi:hypothetical protein
VVVLSFSDEISFGFYLEAAMGQQNKMKQPMTA